LALHFLLLDANMSAGIIVRSDGSGAYGGGDYDILGPRELRSATQPSRPKLGYVALYGIGLGPNQPNGISRPGVLRRGANTNPVNLLINT